MSDGDGWHPPNWFDKINFIISYLCDPCDAPITVYATTFRPALLDFLVAYFQPDLSNIFVNLFRWSYVGRSIRTKRKGRHGRKSNNPKGPSVIGSILEFDIDEFLASKLSLFSKLEKTRATFGIATMWIVEGLVERLNFWLFMFEIILDLFYSWSSLMKKTVYCQAQGMNVLLAYGGPQELTGVFGWVGLLMPDIQKQRGAFGWNQASGSYYGHTGHLMVKTHIKGVDIGPQDIKCGLRIIVSSLDGGHKTVAAYSTVKPGTESDITVGANIKHGDRFTVEHAVEAGAAVFSDNFISGHGEGAT